MAHVHEHPSTDDAATFWNNRYAESDRIWSGRVNAVLADVAGKLTPGRALDLGSGEGGDAIWLAEQGWTVTGVEISDVALARAAEAAGERGVADRIRWVGADLGSWAPDGEYDLVSGCFFQSPITLSRHDILRRVAAAIVPGGHLLTVAHASVPSWAAHRHEGNGPELLEAAEEAAVLALPADSWALEIVEDRPRQVTGPEGQQAEILDSVVLARRL